MQKIQPAPSLEQPIHFVKSTFPVTGSTSSDTMIHHNVNTIHQRIIIRGTLDGATSPYGVSSSFRVLSPGLLLKKYDNIREGLQYVLGLTTAQREVTLRLLRYWAYYGKVYPKEASVTEEPGCKKATFWRTIRRLEDLGLVQVVNRFVIRPHAQISNLYRLDRLILLLARYLAEHGAHFWEKWLTPALAMPGRLFWSQIYLTPGDRAGPGAVEFSSS